MVRKGIAATLGKKGHGLSIAIYRENVTFLTLEFSRLYMELLRHFVEILHFSVTILHFTVKILHFYVKILHLYVKSPHFYTELVRYFGIVKSLASCFDVLSVSH